MNKRKGKILLVKGTHSEAIKMAQGLKELGKDRHYFEIKLRTKCQQNNMSKQVRKNWGSPFKELCDNILELKESYSDMEFEYPVYRN